MLGPPVVGIDVGKNFSELVVLTPENSVHSRQRVEHNSDSLFKALQLIRKVEEDLHATPAIVMEATGHYNKILFNFFVQYGYAVNVVNPIQTNSIKNISVRKVKNDKTDAYRIALLYRFRNLKQTNIPTDEIAILRSLCRHYHNLIEERSMYKNRMQSVLDQIMLSYSKVFSDVFCNTSLCLLEKWSSPIDILAADRDELVNFIFALSKKPVGWAETKYELLIKAATDFKEISLSSPCNITMLRSYIRIIKTFDESISQIHRDIENLVSEDAQAQNSEVAHNASLLMSIPGIGYISAATILGEIGGISNFKDSSKLTAFFGVDPSVCQSGNFSSTQNHISKRGHKRLRKILYMVAVSNLSIGRNGGSINPYLLEYYKKKCINKAKKVAMVAVMHKLVLYIFAVLRDQKPFELRSPEEHENTLITRQKAQRLLSA